MRKAKNKPAATKSPATARSGVRDRAGFAVDLAAAFPAGRGAGRGTGAGASALLEPIEGGWVTYSGGGAFFGSGAGALATNGAAGGGSVGGGGSGIEIEPALLARGSTIGAGASSSASSFCN